MDTALNTCREQPSQCHSEELADTTVSDVNIQSRLRAKKQGVVKKCSVCLAGHANIIKIPQVQRVV